MTIRNKLASEWQTVRELRHLQIRFDPQLCTGTWQCYEVCPIGCWSPDFDNHIAVFEDGGQCVACGACVLQCKPKAIRLEVR